MTLRCLLVDDDPDIRELVGDYLRGFGFEVELANDGAALRQRLPNGNLGGLDMLLLDLMLPDDSGLALCQWAKRHWPALPIIMLTAQGDPLSRVLGLELGADDYLPKPFEPRELVARIKAVLRRGQALGITATTAHELRFGGWRFDRLQRQLRSPDGVLLPLSAAEFRLLSVFVDHPRQVLSRDRLLALAALAGTAGKPAGERSVDLAVSRLRSKLGGGSAEAGTSTIRTVRGEGYVFEPPSA